jgi:hypothetical protein
MKKEGMIRNRRQRRGSAGIILVIIIVLALGVFAVQKWLKSRTPDPDTAENLQPWTEWKIREKSEKPVPPIGPKQPKLTKSLKYDANVEAPQTKAGRGEVMVWITPEGGISGTWSGNYYDDKKMNCEIQGAGFTGKVFPGKIYKDEKGEDPTKLYFLAKGKVVMHKSDLKSKYSIQSGDMYVHGWLNTDLSVIGNLTITGDEKKSETYSWDVSRPVPENTGKSVAPLIINE